MKKITLAILVMAIFCVVSCKKEETSPSVSPSTQTTATVTPTILESFTTTGTFQFTIPSNVTVITAEVWGGGGGGGSSFNPNASGGSGGGGGGYGQLQISVIPGSVYTITVGNGGAPGNATASNVYVSGTAGGTSSVGTNTQTLVSATGGSGGCYCGGYSNGGQGSNGNISGSEGGDGSAGGSGGNGGTGGSSPGQNGSFPGGGGAGGISGNDGGFGSDGQVVITTLNTTNIPDTTITYFTVTSWLQNLPTVWESSNDVALTASNNYIVSMSTSGNVGTYTQQLPSTGTTGFSYRVGEGHIDIVFGGSSAPSGTLYFLVKGF